MRVYIGMDFGLWVQMQLGFLDLGGVEIAFVLTWPGGPLV